jgi:hypothetical protein
VQDCVKNNRNIFTPPIKYIVSVRVSML